nr:hypothetical protein [Tanacetum cinerariifolium]
MTDNSQKAQCKHCFHFLSQGSNTTLRNHITHPHCEVIKAQKNQNPEAGQTSMARDESVFRYDPDYLHEQFAGLVIQQALPFNHFDHEQTTRVFQNTMQPRYTHVSRSTIKRDAMRLWLAAKQEIIDSFEADAVTLLMRIRKFFVAQDIGARVAVHIFNRINFAIAKKEGAQIVFRLLSNLFELVMKRVTKTIMLMETIARINDPQCELLLLRACFGISKLYFAMRTCSPQVFEMAQPFFDAALRSALNSIVTASGPGFGDWQWRLSTLPFAFARAWRLFCK